MSPDATAGNAGIQRLLWDQQPEQTDAGKAKPAVLVWIGAVLFISDADRIPLQAAAQHSDREYQQQAIDAGRIPARNASRYNRFDQLPQGAAGLPHAPGDLLPAVVDAAVGDPRDPE
jgi:hypothetical protein